MIKILKSSEKGFIQINEIEKSCWVNVSNPSTDELNRLSTDLDIPLDFLTDALDVDVNGKVKVYQLWENKSVPPRGKKLVPMRVELSYHHLPVDQNV